MLELENMDDFPDFPVFASHPEPDDSTELDVTKAVVIKSNETKDDVTENGAVTTDDDVIGFDMDPIVGDGTSEVPEQYGYCAIEVSDIMTEAALKCGLLTRERMGNLLTVFLQLSFEKLN